MIWAASMPLIPGAEVDVHQDQVGLGLNRLGHRALSRMGHRDHLKTEMRQAGLHVERDDGLIFDHHQADVRILVLLPSFHARPAPWFARKFWPS